MKKFFTGNRKYLSLFFILLALLFASGFLFPGIIGEKKDNWDLELREKITGILNYAGKELKYKELFIYSSQEKAARLIGLLDSVNSFAVNEALRSSGFDSLLIHVYSRGALIGWNDNFPGLDDRIDTENRFEGGAFFIRSGLYYYLASNGSFTINGKNYQITTALPIEKLYEFRNKFYKAVSFTKELSEKFNTGFEIKFSSEAGHSLDGRDHSVDIANLNGDKIGVLVFQKPSLDVELSSINDIAAVTQGIITLMLAVSLWFLFWTGPLKYSGGGIKLAFIAAFCVSVRVLLYVFEIPAKFAPGEITNPAYFSSAFAYGIVRSPLEFFITVFFFLVISVAAYIYTLSFFRRDNKSPVPLKFLFVLVPPLLFVYLLILRGLGASFRSIIFDSTLRYFKETSLIPDAAYFVMHTGIFLLAFGVVITAIVLLLLIFKAVKASGRSPNLSIFFWIFLFFQLAGILFDLLQKNPQGTPFIRIVFITLTFIFIYLLVFSGRKGKYTLALIAIGSSVISVSLLNYYNYLLERESLKTTAFEIMRPNNDFIEFLIKGTLNSAAAEKRTLTAIAEGDDPDFRAFTIWNESLLQNEPVEYKINILDSNYEMLGSFGLGGNDFSPVRWNWLGDSLKELKIYEDEFRGGKDKQITGIIPVDEKGVNIGYIELAVLYDFNTFKEPSIPVFLSSFQNKIVSPVETGKIKLFYFENGDLVNSASDIKLNSEEISKIISAKFSSLNEAWLSMEINSELHRVYVLKQNNGGAVIIAAALKEKEVSWSLFDFFKVFFIHSLFITLLIALFLISDYRRIREKKYYFRVQLLVSLLVISLLPALLLAVFFRDLTERKNSDAVFYKLGKRAEEIERFADKYSAGSTVNLLSILQKGGTDQGINFTVFEKENMIFSTERNLYRIGLIPDLLNSSVFRRIFLDGEKEIVTTEKIDNYEFNSLYYLASIGGKEYVIKISDAFNPILLPLSDTELDAILFGAYSFTVVLIIIFSTIMANRISAPVIQLTLATKAVSEGDLSVTLDEKEKGEIGDLIGGFNLMVKKLKKSQAELAAFEREAAWKEMARQVAHEIKNPLTPMKLSMQQLIAAYKDKSPKFDEIFNKVSETIIGQIETLKNIASEFSSFARMPRLKLAKIELIREIEETCALYDGKEIKIELIKPEREIFISADADQLKGMFINFIRNSIQAGAGNLSINISALNKTVSIEISDNGGGILPEHRERIFEENFSTKKEGMGLGLSLAKKFAESISGKIILKDSGANGTVFLLTIPEAE